MNDSSSLDSRLSVSECRKYLQGFSMTDSQIIVLRDALYSTAEIVLDEHYKRYNERYGKET